MQQGRGRGNNISPRSAYNPSCMPLSSRLLAVGAQGSLARIGVRAPWRSGLHPLHVTIRFSPLSLPCAQLFSSSLHLESDPSTTLTLPFHAISHLSLQPEAFSEGFVRTRSTRIVLPPTVLRVRLSRGRKLTYGAAAERSTVLRSNADTRRLRHVICFACLPASSP